MALDIARRQGPKASDLTGRAKWPLGAAGALVATAASIYLAFHLALPQEGVAQPAEVGAAIQDIDEFEAQKKAAPTEELPAQF